MGKEDNNIILFMFTVLKLEQGDSLLWEEKISGSPDASRPLFLAMSKEDKSKLSNIRDCYEESYNRDSGGCWVAYTC